MILRTRHPRRTFAVLVLACLTLVTLDYRGGTGSPVEPLRGAVGTVVGPLEHAAATLVRPFRSAGETFRTNSGLRHDVAQLEAENSSLRGELATSALARNRARELDGLLRISRRTEQALLPARVVAFGPAQSFSRTVTIDVGSDAGLRPDMTVLNQDGLVGRVLRLTAGTATVLLVADSESVVGGRLGSSMEIGFVRGRGDLGSDGRLDLELVDSSVVPRPGDVVTTWGSRTDAPYVAGVPIGVVESVNSSPRQLAKQVVLRPVVDFSSLDVVGVVVSRSTPGVIARRRR